jgi:hypothetical protein
MATVHPITIPYQISRRSIFGEGFDDLLRRPFCGGMLRHIEMHRCNYDWPKFFDSFQMSEDGMPESVAAFKAWLTEHHAGAL